MSNSAQEKAKAALARTTETLEAQSSGARPGSAPPRTIMEALQDPDQQRQIQLALPGAMDVQRFTRICLTAVRANPTLQRCTVLSLLAACMQSAQLGLEPGVLGHSYLVPFWSSKRKEYDVQFIVGFQGYIELFYRSEKVTSVVAREVCENDHWEQSYGLDDHFLHRPAKRDRGEPELYYGLARFVNGDRLLHVMNLEEIAKHRAYSKTADDGPWKSHPEAMSRKTTIRAMVPYMPKTVALAQAVMADESVPLSIGPNMADELVVNPSAPEEVVEPEREREGVLDVEEAPGASDEEPTDGSGDDAEPSET